MDISEMHKVFRVLSQQMGLHLVRGILSESIDVYINIEIEDLIRRELMQNSMVEVQNNSNYNSISISSINTFRTLHCKQEFTLSNVSFTEGKYETTLINFDPLFILKVNLKDNENKIYASRIVNSDLVASTIADYCSSPDKNNPIVTFYNKVDNDKVDNDKVDNNKFAIYCTDKDAIYSIVEVDYIKKPNKVNLSTSTNCDLPEHLHNGIVENAVKRFYNAMNIASTNNKNLINQ